jgi:ribosomal protein L40E
MMSMPQQKPDYGFMMSLIGGIFILVDGAVGLMMGIRFGRWAIWIWDFPNSELVLGPIGVVLGTLILVAAMMGYKKADKGLIVGTVIIVASIASFILTMGGYVIGFGFALIGGILFVVWEPDETKNCLRCGKEIKLDSWNCPHCGYMYYQPYPYYPSPQYQYQQGQPQAGAQAQPATAQQAPITPAPPGQKFCMQCGAAVAEGATFCSNCHQQV